MPLESIAGAAGAWLWDKYGQTLADKMAGEAKERWAKFNWGQAAEKYRQRVKALYGTTRILGNPKPVSLEGIFTDAYLLDKPTALRRFELEQLKEMYAGRDTAKPAGQRRSALRLATEQKRLFILGKPGAGKTTFLRYVALQAANGQLDKVPIFVSLKEWSDSGLELMPFLVRQFEICAFPEAQAFIEHILTEGQAMVLFDGLDEVNQTGKQRDRIIDNIKNFSQQFWDSSCLITCRNAAEEYIFEQFAYVEVADFDDNQIRVFVRNRFQDDPTKAQNFMVEFEKSEYQQLRELANTPLLLTLLCLVFDEKTQFPQKQAELYEDAVDLLLKQWDDSRRIKRDEIYRKLSLSRKRHMLARIAAETFEQGEYFFRQADLAKRISLYLRKLPPADFDEDVDGEAVLKAIEHQHGLLVERAHKIYSFSHLTFQEYFTAKFIAEDASEGTLARVIEMHLGDERWREVFLLTVSLLPEAELFFSLAQQSVSELIRSDETLMALLRWTNQKAADYGRWGRGLALSLTRDLIHAIDRAHVLAHSFSLDINRARSIDFYLYLALARAQNLHLTELVHTLRDLAEPDESANAATWGTFAADLQALMIKYHNVGYYWDLTPEQWERLHQFDRANRLLYDCLQLAYVSDRAGIEARLWSAPGERR